MNQCVLPSNVSQRIFWTTQPDACGEYTSCGFGCGRPGLKFVSAKNCTVSCCCGDNANLITPCTSDNCSKPRTIANNNWLSGIAINILLTDSRRKDSNCGYKPYNINGHFSDSFITGGNKVGTGLRYISTNMPLAKTIEAIKSEIKASLSKLISYGVAREVNVKVTYTGNNLLHADIELISSSGNKSNVGISGQRALSHWNWT